MAAETWTEAEAETGRDEGWDLACDPRMAHSASSDSIMISLRRSENEGNMKESKKINAKLRGNQEAHG